MASGSTDGTIKLWDLKAQPAQEELEGRGAVRSWSGMQRPPLAFSPDGSQVWTVSTNGNAILIWQAASGALHRRVPLDHGSPPRSLIEFAISPRDGTCAVACVETNLNRHFVELWNIPEERRISAFPGRIPLCFAADGAWLASGGIEARTLQVTNLIDGRSWTIRFDATQDLVDAILFSPDGRLLAAACEGELVLYDTSRGGHLSTLTRWTNATPINALALAPDGKTLAVGRFSPRVELWDVGRRVLIAELPGHLAQVTSLAISPDGKTLATGRQNGTLQLWSLELREELLHLQAHPSGIYSLAFSPDGSVLASGGAESTVRLWRASSRQP